MYILVAGDDATLLDVLAGEIASEGYDVIVAMNGQEAYEQVLAHDPAVVFVRASMPVFNGFETCALLRGDPDIGAKLPVFVVTDESVDPHKLDEAGATGVFPVTHDAHDVRELLAAYATTGF